MNKYLNAILTLLFSVFVSSSLFAGGTVRTNPPSECSAPNTKCNCPQEGVSANCIKVNIGLGETTPWTGSLGCSLKIFADDDSPSVFTPESLHAVLGGYTFKRLGQKTMADGVTPAEVVLSHPNGEAVHFVFANDESLGRPDPGVHIKMDARLQMVDAEGWATTHDPVYYDLYVGDGTRRRFLATNMTGALGALVSITDARGKTIAPADMGVDIVYDPDGVRQYLTPSRLANVTRTADFLGYDVAVYALQEPPQKNTATGLYIVPEGQTVEHVSVRRENGGKRAVVTIRKGGGDPLRYVFDYAMGDWSLTRSSGVEEVKSRNIYDSRAAQTVTEVLSSSRTMLERTECNYKWMSWGFAMTNKVEGFDGVTDTTTWTYYTSGNGKGQVKTEKRQSGLLIQYAYDNLDRIISKTRSGPGMMTEVTTYDYTPVDASDPMLPVDTRPRTVVRKLNNIECERTYYVYSPLTNIVERVGEQGAAYGGTNVLRTVTTFYPVEAGNGEPGTGNGEPVGADHRAARAGFVASIRHEDGKLDLYDYELSSNLWVHTVTHIHEQSPSPVSGKTTRDVTLTNARGETTETRTEAFIDGIWYTIARNQMTYNSEGKRITSENLAGQVTTTAWDCCHKVSESEPDGSTTTWDYDAEGHMIASSRLIPLDMTNVTWLTTCYEYDDLGRQTATWQTNYAAQVGLPATRTRYDALGRVIARVDTIGNTTTTEYSPDGRTVFVRNPNSSTVTTTRSASGDVLSITGTAVTPEFITYGILPDGTRWSKTVQGETASSPRFTKHYENLLDQTIREERSGFQGAVLATTHTYDAYGRLVSTSADYEPTVEYTYDVLGNRVATTKTVGGDDPGVPQFETTEWRKSESLSHIAIIDGDVWLTQTNIVSCSDSAIAPLVSSSARQLTGLTAALPARSRSFDIRGNVTVNEMLVDSSIVASRQTLPYATNKPLSLSRYGVSLMDVSVSAVTNTAAYDSIGRAVAHTDGRGNTTLTEYNSFGQRSAYIDALGNRTSYVYDRFGHLVSATNPLGITTVYEYDLRGHKLYEGGASYPVRYAYDVFGRKISMRTFRDQANAVDDETVWNYDEAIDVVTNKVYADGKRVEYCYDAIGRNTQRIWARGVTTTYSYDNWGNLIQREYSDGTPAVRITYDAVGRLKHVADESGIFDFEYNDFGDQTAKVMDGISGHNEIAYFFDSYGRDIGYTINGVRISELEYDPTTTRLIAMKTVGCDTNFVWSYLSGSDLKNSLIAPNGVSTTWRYDDRDQMTEVCNATPTNVISRYAYSYNAIGQRSRCEMSGVAFDSPRGNQYLYNSRCELTNVVALGEQSDFYSYNFDDIGNRLMSIERGELSRFAINEINQTTNIVVGVGNGEVFTPIYDADGNQILVKTETGVWHVTYNGENRPVKWERNDRTVNITYDFLGRMAARNGVGFIYDGFKLIYDTSNNYYVWDPSEIRSFHPLALFNGTKLAYYFFDGNKNVSEVIMLEGDIGCHYEYSPFGQTIKVIATNDFANPFRFSSEYYDEELGVISYLARNYNCRTGRWLQRDHGGEDFGLNLYAFVHNDPVSNIDYLGFKGFDCRTARSQFYKDFGMKDKGSSVIFSKLYQLKKIGLPEISIGVNVSVENKVCKECCGGGRVGYSIDRTTEFSVVGGISIEITPWGPFSPWSFPVGVSYSLGGGSHYTYNSCTGEETSQKCNTFALTGSVGAAVGLGKFISYKGSFSISYSWSNCSGKEESSLKAALDVEQCYWGICWSANLLTIPDDFMKD